MNPHNKWCVQVYVLVEMFTFPWSDPFVKMLTILYGPISIYWWLEVVKKYFCVLSVVSAWKLKTDKMDQHDDDMVKQTEQDGLLNSKGLIAIVDSKGNISNGKCVCLIG